MKFRKLLNQCMLFAISLNTGTALSISPAGAAGVTAAVLIGTFFVGTTVANHYKEKNGPEKCTKCSASKKCTTCKEKENKKPKSMTLLADLQEDLKRTKTEQKKAQKFLAEFKKEKKPKIDIEKQQTLVNQIAQRIKTLNQDIKNEKRKSKN